MKYDLSYEQFKDMIQDEIKNFLPEEYQNADVSVVPVQKQGDQFYDALLIRKENDPATPSLYLNDFYKFNYRDGQSMDEIMQQLADMRTGFEVFGSKEKIFDAKDLVDFENIKEKIVARVIDPKSNAAYLADKPHTMFNDLAVMYAATVGNIPAMNGTNGQGSMPVTDKLLEAYGVSVEELHKVAIENMTREGANIKPMADYLMGMLGTDMDFADLPNELKVLVITNNTTMHGSAMMLNPEAMEKASEMIGGDFAICPSSVHEILALPVAGADEQALNQIINDVNISAVGVQDRLSSHIYVYDAEVGQVVMPEVYFGHEPFDPEHINDVKWETFKEEARLSFMEPQFDQTRSDYYGNARVYAMYGDQVLESYGAPIAFTRDNETFIIGDNVLSPAQSGHVVEFANQAAGEEKYTSISEISRYQDKETAKEAPTQEKAQTKEPTNFAKQQLFDNEQGLNRS